AIILTEDEVVSPLAILKYKGLHADTLLQASTFTVKKRLKNAFARTCCISCPVACFQKCLGKLLCGWAISRRIGRSRRTARKPRKPYATTSQEVRPQGAAAWERLTTHSSSTHVAHSGWTTVQERLLNPEQEIIPTWAGAPPVGFLTENPTSGESISGKRPPWASSGDKSEDEADQKKKNLKSRSCASRSPDEEVEKTSRGHFYSSQKVNVTSAPQLVDFEDHVVHKDYRSEQNHDHIPSTTPVGAVLSGTRLGRQREDLSTSVGASPKLFFPKPVSERRTSRSPSPTLTEKEMGNKVLLLSSQHHRHPGGGALQEGSSPAQEKRNFLDESAVPTGLGSLRRSCGKRWAKGAFCGKRKNKLL
ncbi:unnamed protein product, partial [Amoebophrya sp. A25]